MYVRLTVEQQLASKAAAIPATNMGTGGRRRVVDANRVGDQSSNLFRRFDQVAVGEMGITRRGLVPPVAEQLAYKWVSVHFRTALRSDRSCVPWSVVTCEGKVPCRTGVLFVHGRRESVRPGEASFVKSVTALSAPRPSSVACLPSPAVRCAIGG